MKRTKHSASEAIDGYITRNFFISEQLGVENINDHPAPYLPAHGVVFILILSGKAVLGTNGKAYPVSQAMLISVIPFQSYLFREPSADFCYEYISYELDFMADFPLILNPDVADRMEKVPCLHLKKDSFRLLKEYHRNMRLQYERYEHPSRINITKAMLYIFVAEVNYLYSRQAVNIKKTRPEQITDDFLRLLHTFYRKERKPEFYADHLCLSPKYLTKILKDVTGKSLYFWICEFVIKNAKILLHSSDSSVSQISDELNFPNSSYFARYFRRYTGISPIEFRKLFPASISS